MKKDLKGTPNSWIVEGFDEQKNLVTIDEQKQNECFKPKGYTTFVNIPCKSKEWFSQITIRQTQPNNNNKHEFRLANVEFVGYYRSPD